jgi:DNA mismatch repair protein MutL
MTGRPPVTFLFLDVPPEAVDVTVHPTKAEVRFRQPDKVRQFVLDAVRQALQAADLTVALRAPKAAPPPVRQPDLPLVVAPPAPEARRRAENVATAQVAVVRPPPTAPTQRQAPAPTMERQPPARPVKAVQMHELYLVVEGPEGILVIDQHALHERVLFERLKARHAQSWLDVQRLLVPEPLTR